jgi:hypothetical protein
MACGVAVAQIESAGVLTHRIDRFDADVRRQIETLSARVVLLEAQLKFWKDRADTAPPLSAAPAASSQHANGPAPPAALPKPTADTSAAGAAADVKRWIDAPAPGHAHAPIALSSSSALTSRMEAASDVRAAGPSSAVVLSGGGSHDELIELKTRRMQQTERLCDTLAGAAVPKPFGAPSAAAAPSAGRPAALSSAAVDALSASAQRLSKGAAPIAGSALHSASGSVSGSAAAPDLPLPSESFSKIGQSWKPL